MTANDQLSFLVDRPTPKPGVADYPKELYYLVLEFDEGSISKPDFQRDYVWPMDKAKSWLEHVISQQAIGVIVTYQLDGGSRNFIADGLQRLTTGQRFLKNPKDFGFEFTTQQAKEYLLAYRPALQHRVYPSHDAAMTAFHNLNDGTNLTAKEYFGGIMKLNEAGKVIYTRVPSIVESYERSLVDTRGKRGREHQDKLHRSALALFFQYISGTETKTFWDVTSLKIGPVKSSVEYNLIQWITNHSKSITYIEDQIRYFEKYIAEQTALVTKIISDMGMGQRGKVVSPTTMRWIFHLAIWRKNTKRSPDLYIKFLEKLLKEMSKYQTFTSRLTFTAKNEEIIFISLAASKLDKLVRLCEFLDVPLDERETRRKSKPVANGYHNSHKKPFATHGDGETFIEPGFINRARGAKQIDDDDSATIPVPAE